MIKLDELELLKSGGVDNIISTNPIAITILGLAVIVAGFWGFFFFFKKYGVPILKDPATGEPLDVVNTKKIQELLCQLEDLQIEHDKFRRQSQHEYDKLRDDFNDLKPKINFLELKLKHVCFLADQCKWKQNNQCPILKEVDNFCTED